MSLSVRTLLVAFSAVGIVLTAPQDRQSYPNVIPRHDEQTPVNIKSFNCSADDEHDDTACFVAARNQVRSRIRANSTPSSNGNKLGGLKLYLPAGTYLITEPEALMASDFGTRTEGYQLEGDGAGLTLIDYRPKRSGALLSNRDAFMSVTIRGVSFTSNSAQADFLDSYSTGGAQNYLFSDVEWIGLWATLFKLTGQDTNSEWDWDHVACAGEIANVLYIPQSGTSDQFLNYWFHNSRIDLSRGNFINAWKGGHFKITDCDFSGLNGSGDPSKPDILFALRGRAHSRGVTHFECKNSRFELKTNSIKVLYSEWGNFGEVSFEDDDFSSQTDAYPPREEFEINMAGSAGAAQYNFLRCHLTGSVTIEISNDDWGYRRNVSFEDVQFLSYDDYTQGVVFNLPPAGNSNYGGIPIVECVRCTGANRNIFIQKPWKPNAPYHAAEKVFSNGYVYETATGGTSGKKAPVGRTKMFDDGGVKWSTVDLFWGSDYAQNAELRPWPYISNGYSGVLKTALISDQTFYNELPRRFSDTTPGFSRVILPAYATILRIQLIVVPGSADQTSRATYIARTDNYAPHEFFTHRIESLRSGGSYDYNLPIPYNVGTDIGSRTVILQANADVVKNAAGWFLITYL